MLSLPAVLAGSSALWASLATAAASADDAFLSLPTFAIPAFDYYSLDRGESPELLLKQLQANGIIALRNVPTFSSVREAYLLKAAECAMLAADSAEGDFLTFKAFEDGTKRHTINTNAGLELLRAAESTQGLCPGYRELYLEFSELLERAVNSFGRALDATAFTASDGERVISSRQLISEAVRLDHFHAYEAAQSKSETFGSQRSLELSLPMHEDHGLFIAMAAPKFYEVEDDRRLVERSLATDASGLVIQTAAGERVRPVLKEDEVIIMMGTGGSRWLQTSHRIPAVMHGMKMPESVGGGATRSLRAWFGKMTLLPAYQRLLKDRDVTFDRHVNLTTRFLLEHDDDDLKTIGCATGRMLAASEGSCAFRSCSTKAGATAPTDGCAKVCNRSGHSASDATECSSKCACSDGGAGEICWMLCVATLDSCGADKQTCNSQALVCPESASTPSPATVAPATTTTAPTSAAPATTTPTPSPSPSSTTATSIAPTTTVPAPTPSPSPSTQAPADLSFPETTGSASKSSTGGSAGDSSTDSLPSAPGSLSLSPEDGDTPSSDSPPSTSSNVVVRAVAPSDAGSDAVDASASEGRESSMDSGSSAPSSSSTDSGAPSSSSTDSGVPSSSSTDSGANLPPATLALASSALFSAALAADLL